MRCFDVVVVCVLDGLMMVIWCEYVERVWFIVVGLVKFGVWCGDMVGIMLTNWLEFHLVDIVVLYLGAMLFLIYNMLVFEQIVYLFSNVGNWVVVCEEQFVERFWVVGDVQHFVCVDVEFEGMILLVKVELDLVFDFDFDASWWVVIFDDVFMIIYMFGMIGLFKGVELIYVNMLVELVVTSTIVLIG